MAANDKVSPSRKRLPEQEDRQGAAKKPAWESTNTVFTNEKGGMVGYDKNQVKKIIYEMSKDSPHFVNEQRKQKHTELKIKRLLEQKAKLSPAELAGHTRKMDAKVSALLAERDLSKTWMHVDLDAFFASVEELDDPSLKSKPMGVGGIGMLSTANYVARRYGIRSAMPGFIARRLCPELVFVRPDFSKYSRASRQVRAVLRDFDEALEAGSLDEAYMDVTDYCAANGVTGPEVAAEVRRKVFERTGLTCSCGVAPNSMLAKVCSDMNKPDGQFALPADAAEIGRFLDSLSIRKLPGIGKVGEQELNALGVHTCGDLVASRGLLAALFSELAAETFLAAGLGLGRSRHHDAPREGEVGRKGMSVERTFAPISATTDLEAKCCELAAKLAEDMEGEELRGKTLTLKLKPPTFEVKTRAVTLPAYVSSEAEIRAAALRLLRAELPISVRLMGLRMSNFHQAVVPMGQKSLAAFFKPKGVETEAETAAASMAQDMSAEAAADEARQESEADSPEQPDPESKKATGTSRQQRLWVCQMCTFAENPRHFLRCLICDSLRGSAPRAAVETPPVSGGQEAETTGASGSASDSRSLPQPEDSTNVCEACGQAVPEGGSQEHRDWHLALALGKGASSSPGRRHGRPRPADAKPASKDPGRSGLAPITQFFKPRQKR